MENLGPNFQVFYKKYVDKTLLVYYNSIVRRAEQLRSVLIILYKECLMMIYTAKDIERICKSEVTYKVIRDQFGGFGEFWAEFHGNLILHGNLRSITGAPINERDDT